MLLAHPIDVRIPSDQVAVVDLRGRLAADLERHLASWLRQPELEHRRIHQILVLLLHQRVLILRVGVAVLLAKRPVQNPRIAPSVLKVNQISVPRAASFWAFKDPVDWRELGTEIAPSLVRVGLDAVPSVGCFAAWQHCAVG